MPEKSRQSKYGEALEERLFTLCTLHKLTIGLAESCTGGALAARITQVAGASQYFLGSIVSYTNAIKSRILRVPPIILERYGAVSAPTALMMLEGVFTEFPCDFGLAVTGFAGPSGGTPDTPIGTIFIAVGKRTSTPNVLCLQLQGDRQSIIQESVDESLKLLIDTLENP